MPCSLCALSAHKHTSLPYTESDLYSFKVNIVQFYWQRFSRISSRGLIHIACYVSPLAGDAGDRTGKFPYAKQIFCHRAMTPPRNSSIFLHLTGRGREKKINSTRPTCKFQPINILLLPGNFQWNSFAYD